LFALFRVAGPVPTTSRAVGAVIAAPAPAPWVIGPLALMPTMPPAEILLLAVRPAPVTSPMLAPELIPTMPSTVPTVREFVSLYRTEPEAVAARTSTSLPALVNWMPPPAGAGCSARLAADSGAVWLTDGPDVFRVIRWRGLNP